MNDSRPTPGSRLKAERELRGLSAQKAADEMHLDAWVIDALESGDYARIGPTVYAKGHLRKYASMLGLPLAEIMADFEPQEPAARSRDDSSVPVGSRHGAAASRVVSPGQAAASLAAVVLLIGVMWWQPWQQRSRGPADSGPDTRSPAGSAPAASTLVEGRGVQTPAVATAGAAAQEHGTAANRDADAPGTTTKAAAAASSGATAATATTAGGHKTPSPASLPAAVAAAPGAGRARLRLSFSSDSWVDVRDALGNRAYAGNGSANTVKTIAGNAPLHVYLRSANGVQMEINGRAVAIGPQFFSGDVARFEAGADGVLRRDESRDATKPEQPPARPPG
jgi:cytoskeleton protein RodZ